MKNRILVSLGESSGDRMAVMVLTELQKRHPGLKLMGSAGPETRKVTGFQCLYPQEKLARTGFLELLPALPLYLRLYRHYARLLKKGECDLLFLVDFPGLNLLLLERARRAGVPVYYLSPPQIWAWKAGRAKKFLKKNLQIRLQLLMDFEKASYEGVGLGDKLHMGGHPALEYLKVDKKKGERLGLFPGSRISSVSRNLPLFLQSAQIFNYRRKKRGESILPVEVVLPSTLCCPLELPPNVELYSRDPRRDGRRWSHAISLPGTGCLELALLGIPTVLALRVPLTTYILARCFLETKRLALPNILLKRQLFPEFIQNHAQSELLAHALENFDLCELSRAAEELRTLLGPDRFTNEAAKGLEEILNGQISA